MNEHEAFLKSLEEKEGESVIDTALVPAKEEKEVLDDPELQDESVKNRRHRRLEAKLLAEREEKIAYKARLEALAEAQKFRTDATSDTEETLARIFGTNTPEAQEATKLFKKALDNEREKAVQTALEKFKAEQSKSQEEAKSKAGAVDTILEQIEDEHNVDLTSEKAADTRKGYIKLLEKLSPKDSQGNVIAYADPEAVWEEYQLRSKKSDTTRRELASRSMVRSGANAEVVEQDAHAKFLREHGII